MGQRGMLHLLAGVRLQMSNREACCNGLAWPICPLPCPTPPHHTPPLFAPGVEFAGTLSDFLREDLKKKYPELMPYVRVTLLNSAQTILTQFDDRCGARGMCEYGRSMAASKKRQGL